MKNTVKVVMLPTEPQTTHNTRSESEIDMHIDMMLSSMSRRERRKIQRQYGLVSRRVDNTIKKTKA